MKRRDVGAEKSSWLPSITLDDVTFSSMVEKWERENGHSVDPLESLRKKCNECNCDPCECEEEWNSVEEISSETESSMEEIS